MKRWQDMLFIDVTDKPYKIKQIFAKVMGKIVGRKPRIWPNKNFNLVSFSFVFAYGYL